MAASTARVNDLLDGYRAAELTAAQAADRYTEQRQHLTGRLVTAGLPADGVELLLDAYERLWEPDFGAGPARVVGNEHARRLHDAAVRAGVTSDEWHVFVAALKEQRDSETRSNGLSRHLYSVGGYDALAGAKSEVEDLLELRRDVITIARRMNPALDIATAGRLVEDAELTGPARLDPLRQLVAVSLDLTAEPSPKRAVYARLWESIDGLLGEKERKVLEETYGRDADRNPLPPAERAAKAAEAFAAYMAPDRRKRRAVPLFETAKAFVGRVANAARGRGYQTAEDILRRAERGDVAKRAERDGAAGLRVPAPSADAGAHERMKEAIAKLTDHELAKAIRDQKDVLDAARKKRQGLLRNLVTYNPAVRAAKSVVGFLGTEGGDALREDDRQIRELARGLAMLNATQTARVRDRALAAVGTAGLSAAELETAQKPAPAPRSLAEMTAAAIDQQLRGLGADAGPATHDGRHGIYTVQPTPNGSAAPDGGSYGFRIGLQVPGADERPIGLAQTVAVAGEMITAFENVTANGRASMLARALAQTANNAGHADIDTIRKSGLLDEGLDALIGRRDAYAFVYPLKSGDLIFQTDDGRWRAATAAEFKAYALQHGNEHLRAAAEVIPLADRAAAVARDREGRAVPVDAAAPAAAASPRSYLEVPPSDEARAREAGARFDERLGRFYVPEGDAAAHAATQQWRDPDARERAEEEKRAIAGAASREELPRDLAGSPQAPVADPAALAARVLPVSAETAEPFRIDPALPRAERQAAAEKVPPEELPARHAATAAALQAVQQRVAAGEPKTPEMSRALLELTAGRTALETTMREKGMTFQQLETPAKARAKSRDPGQER